MLTTRPPSEAIRRGTWATGQRPLRGLAANGVYPGAYALCGRTQDPPLRLPGGVNPMVFESTNEFKTNESLALAPLGERGTRKAGGEGVRPNLNIVRRCGSLRGS